ncbi:uncharacterized protein XM38_002670 [Halomicronema hongdechloris C2206]|uniref:Glycoside hydrolase family 57 N-terminal domain-containing protein n=1 Tax=Halomicronema hongdechloris C2206 TaxID=1641165 RepID=A0A1Z3HGB0_9CYAN|nr:DUF3536 domain-containing protein [Halomicronema hongdechloris]ASC69340.1 uncharacterized protein XM38_002670 [Halomicronema hongdechloris C2206]
MADSHLSVRPSSLSPPTHDPETAWEAAASTTTGVYICIHGHFYQPPRENPYLDMIERQPGAAPFHDWNERIHYECYRPNAFARILNDRGEVIRIVNNYEYISFNMGPTLLSWMERYDTETYQRILEADRRSCERFNGHGNAIAQVYNHIILPLANHRDKVTQVRWGKIDFITRFGRDPEGLWLAETAVDYPTLDVLVDEGIRFIILAPSQAQRCRPLVESNGASGWHEVGGGQIDPTRPYRCFLRQADGHADPNRYIDIFFYDGPISRDMGFSDALTSSQLLAGRLGQAVRGDHRLAQVISVATDGETFGHHRGGAEKTLAYAVTTEMAQHGWTVTNFAHYLSLYPPTWEVELKPVTAWSCSHGVDRWQSDCGCGGGGEWHQQWRYPLRQALDWLRDQLIEVFESRGGELLQDPWAARDEYGTVLCDGHWQSHPRGARPAPQGHRPPTQIKRFLDAHQSHPLTAAEQIDALRLLEMQRHALLMYTSCGWFFEELSRPEGTQILRYAARALELAGDAAGLELEQTFIQRLELAPSNIALFGNGAGIYRQLVMPSRITLEQVAAQYAISSLFTPYSREHQLFCYTIQQQDYQLQRMGPLSLAVGQLSLVSTITQETLEVGFAALHMGSWDFHCSLRPFRSRLAYSRAKEAVFAALSQASAAQTVLAINRVFGQRFYSLQDLVADERHRLMGLLSQETLLRLDQLYTHVYRDNYGILKAFHRDHLPVPQELQVAADITLSQRALEGLRVLDRETSDPDGEPWQRSAEHLSELESLANEAQHFHCQLSLATARPLLERVILRTLETLLQTTKPETITGYREWLARLIQLGSTLGMGISLERAQERYYQYLQTVILPELGLSVAPTTNVAPSALAKSLSTTRRLALRPLLELGELLVVDVAGLTVLLERL